MKNNKKLSFLAWGLWLALLNLFSFLLCEKFTFSFWCTFVFMWIAALTSLIFIIKTYTPQNKPKESILHISLLMIAIGYMLVQSLLSIVLIIVSSYISWETSLLINSVICVLAWLLGIGALLGNDHIEKVNEQQK